MQYLSTVLLILLVPCVTQAQGMGMGMGSAFYVSNEGVDSVACGTKNDKCRSISQAIRNAADGNTILVEPGIYGDLNRNGIIGEPGEESGGVGCDCLIHVDKRVAIFSEAGARATVVDAAGANLNGIRISVSDVVVGLRETWADGDRIKPYSNLDSPYGVRENHGQPSNWE